jgi:hypothetical protein
MGPNGPMATTQQGAVGRAVRNCDRIGRKGVVRVVDIWIRRDDTKSFKLQAAAALQIAASQSEQELKETKQAQQINSIFHC